MPAAPKPESLLFYAVLACLATAGFFYINIMAAIVDGLIKGLGFTKPQAGMVASFNIYGASVGALVAALIVPRIDWKRALVALFTALIVVDLVSTQVVAPTPLMLVRALHGLIGGTSVGIGLSVIARTAAPDRAFGMLLVVQFGLGGLGVMLLPGLVPTYGTAVLFEVLAALTLVTLVMTLLLPRSRIGVAARRTSVAAVDAGRFTALVTLPSIFLFQAANMALSAFIIGLGEAAGLPSAVVTSALGWATWLGAGGAVAVIMIGARWGRFWPLLAAMLLTLVGTAAFHYSASAAVYFAANVGTAITWSFVIPYLFGMSSQFDASGRMAAWCGLFSKLGLASGPLAAGYLVRGEDYSLLINLSVACLVLSALAAFIPARVLDRGQ
jgi:predicted MFS family arabinose efflux permease